MAELKDKLVSLEVLKEYDTAMVSGTLDEVVTAFNDLQNQISTNKTEIGGLK